jgi:para-nitrobenzyl esterase
MGPIAAGGGLMLPSEAEASGLRLAKLLGANSIVSMREVPAHKILAVDAQWPADAAGNVKSGTTAVLDGYVLPDSMYEAFKKGKQNDVPILIGYNANEGGDILLQPLRKL